ncbi:class I adenylate-forming enzyme family protein [Actinophytocola sp.]|uniref:class I adenylate-forming enzyme family protein n=1 Tax=Actinophytocola sp. TaxID=1872138 RepID=UPI002ED52934
MTLRDLDGRTVHGTLAAHAERHPARPFVVFETEPGVTRTIGYGEMWLRARQVAGLLRAAGVSPGDRIGVHLTNCVEFYECWLGAATAGVVTVPTNPLASADELSYLLDHSRCRLVVTQTSLLDTVSAAVKGLPVLVTDVDTLTASTPAEPYDHRSSTAPVSVLYTSGTTSRPKGVVITHASYLAAGDVVAGHLRLTPVDRQLVVLPLFHGNAQFYSTMSALVTGASIALAPRFSASRWSEQATVLDATVTSLFAAPMRMILAAPPTAYDRAHRLRAGMFAQNLSAAQLTAFEERFGVPMIQLYGMTETVTPPTMNPLYGDRRGNAVGRPVTGARLRIVDDRGKDVAPGESGELLVAGEPGHTIMAGYLDNPEATRQAVRNGWLHTGDRVRADEDGYLYFVDRAKDVIKRAGENVASAEVEAAINAHPEVFECAVVGVPDDIRDEAIKAYVVRTEDATISAEQLREWCRTRLAKFRVPDHVEFVDLLPRTSVGKIQKHLLRARHAGSQPQH